MVVVIGGQNTKVCKWFVGVGGWSNILHAYWGVTANLSHIKSEVCDIVWLLSSRVSRSLFCSCKERASHGNWQGGRIANKTQNSLGWKGRCDSSGFNFSELTTQSLLWAGMDEGRGVHPWIPFEDFDWSCWWLSHILERWMRSRMPKSIALAFVFILRYRTFDSRAVSVFFFNKIPYSSATIHFLA